MLSTTETEPQVTLTVKLQMGAADRARLETDGPVLFRLAQDCLRDEPDDAASLVHVARLLVKISCLYDVEASHPENRKRASRPLSAAKGRSSGGKIKHVFGEGGVCAVCHEPGVVCGKIRERAKRGTAAAEPVSGTRTLTIPGVVF